MDATLTFVIVMTVIFLSTFLRATIGFGNALVAMPLLALTLGIQTATPLVALVSQFIAVIMLLEGWQHIDIKALWRLTLASAVGIPAGLVLLTEAPEYLVKGIMGIILIAFGLYNLFMPQLPILRWPGYAYGAGLIAGVLGGAYNTNGPPVIVYGMLSRWPPEQFRASLQGYFFVTGMLIVAGHGLKGLWTTEVLWMFGYSLPCVILATALGYRLSRVLHRQTFEKIIYVFLIFVGLLLLFEG